MAMLLVDSKQTWMRQQLPRVMKAYDGLKEGLENRRICAMIGRDHFALIEECRNSEKALNVVVDVLLTTKNMVLADAAANFFEFAAVQNNLDVMPIHGKLERARDRWQDADIRGKLDEVLLANSQRQLTLAL
ncbi:MAG: hypothetical protein WCT31_00355 [Candidatus Micrarchaeia archaeon]|jgi:hypothetical protein